MFHNCAHCDQTFFECDLRDGKCIDCLSKDARYWRGRDSATESEQDAFGKGYMAAHELIVERGEQDTRLLSNPYDEATQPREYGGWMMGRDARLGAYQLFLRQQNEQVMVTA
jgi:hypothetical protein